MYLAERLGLKYPQPIVNWTTKEDLTNLLYLADFEVVQSRPHILLPKHIPVVSTLVNRFLAPLPIIRSFCVTNWRAAGPWRLKPDRPASVSSICPCRNGAGNIQQTTETDGGRSGSR